ncbi:MAG: 16S rRNA (guanine(966)-N(2))-methyltransferase RsmD [Myxococcales bacterium]|jgi:16S rRNA (guanine966-N2)-methyltransferase
MRIVGGELGGRRLQAPAGSDTRPTTDRVREAIASALQARDLLDGAVVLDLFAGSGALGFEALSRGAARVLSVDRDGRALRCVQHNAGALGVQARAARLKVDLLRDPERAAARIAEVAAGPYSLVFADPPYAAVVALPALLRALVQARLLADDASVVIEHGKGEAPDPPEGFSELSHYRHGDSEVTVLRFCSASKP